jgi:hypothetical protein
MSGNEKRVRRTLVILSCGFTSAMTFQSLRHSPFDLLSDIFNLNVL